MGALRQVNSNLERRYLRQEIRVVSPGSRTIRGYGVVFNRESLVITEKGRRFREIIRPEAARGVDLSAVLCMHNHNASRLIGNTDAGTMRCGVDEVGIWYETDLPESPTGEDVLQSVARRDTQDSSFQFTITDRGEKWENRDGMLYREITQFSEIFEMGPVTEGAYPDTTVAQRHLERHARDLEVTVEVTDPEAPAEPQWALGYVIDNSAWALISSNSMIMRLNDWIAYYQSYANDGTQNAAVFQTLADDCRAAKAALIQLIDSHAAAIKTLNGSENRAVGHYKHIELRSELLDIDFHLLDIDFHLRELEVQL